MVMVLWGSGAGSLTAFRLGRKAPVIHPVARGGPGCRAVPGGSIKTGGRPFRLGEEARHRSELARACTSRPRERESGVGWRWSCRLGQLVVVVVVDVRLVFEAADLAVPEPVVAEGEDLAGDEHSRQGGSPTLGSGLKQSRGVASRHCRFDKPAPGPSACSRPAPGPVSKHIALLRRCRSASSSTNAAQRRRVDGQRLVDRQVEAAASRRRWDEWLSSRASVNSRARGASALPRGAAVARSRRGDALACRRLTSCASRG